jgi:hypothetical protein
MRSLPSARLPATATDPRNLTPAMVGQITNAEVEHLFDPGEFDPDEVHLPGVFSNASSRSTLSRSETRPHAVSWGFAAGSGAWLGPSRDAVVHYLPLG